MPLDRPLRGRCHCGRNRYLISFPRNVEQLPEVLFNPNGYHRFSHSGSPLMAYLRVPLAYYFSSTTPLFPDETTSMIHKLFQAGHEQRRFCGFCGTPLSYWTEEPRSEANYIQLALGSLFPEDLADLEELGLLPESDEDQTKAQTKVGDKDTQMLGTEDDGHERELVIRQGREVVGGVPWLDSLTEGSRLGTLRTTKGGSTNHRGTVRVEWEIVEWTEGDAPSSPRNGKRKLGDRDSGSGAAFMEGV